MPPPQDRYEVNLELVTTAGTEYAMQANLSHYEDVAELEDDIPCFLPTVSDLDVFGCELELLDLHEKQPLSEAFRTVLLQRPQLQLVVRPCMVEGHSIWQFQADGKESYPKAVRVPANPRGEIADRAFYAAPSIPTCGNCGLAELPATTDCQASTLGHKSGGRDLPAVLCAARGRRTRVYPIRSKGVCRVLFPRQCWGQSRNRGHQRPGTRRAAWQTCFRELPYALQSLPLIWIVHINHELCLKAHSVEQALNSCACRLTSTTSG